MSFFDPEAVFSAVEAISQELAAHSPSFLLAFTSSRIESFHPSFPYNTEREKKKRKRKKNDVFYVRDRGEEKMTERSITLSNHGKF